jgi:mRNA-degrading endonuclease RelE of RelBE toxin-antitoxin system
MTDGFPYDLALGAAARRALAEDLSESVAAAIIEFITGALVTQPRVVGKPLHEPLSGVWAARRGAYRVLYRIDEPGRTVLVIRIDHRSDAYRA